MLNTIAGEWINAHLLMKFVLLHFNAILPACSFIPTRKEGFPLTFWFHSINKASL